MKKLFKKNLQQCADQQLNLNQFQHLKGGQSDAADQDQSQDIVIVDLILP